MKQGNNDVENLLVLSDSVDVILSRTYPELSQIQDEIWRQTIEHSKPIFVPKGNVMLHDQPDGRSFKLLLKGEIRVFNTAEDGREITLYRVREGELCILGLNGLFNEETCGIVTEAITPVYLLCISSKDFDELMRSSDIFRQYILANLNKRIVNLMGMVQDTAFNTLSLRLACLLGRLFEQENATSIKVTHQVLASDIGTTREVTSRILKEFERSGCVELSRGVISLISQDVLSQLSEP